MTIQKLEKSKEDWCFYEVGDQLKQFIYKRSNEAFALGDAARKAVQSVEELEARRTNMREKFIESMGGLPSSDSPLNSQIAGVIQCNGFRIEKVIYESRPKTFVTANLYIPEGDISRRGSVLFLCGHLEQAKHDDEFQIVCQYLVRAGLVVLAQDPIGQGERLSYYEKSLGAATAPWGIFEHDYVGSQCWPMGDGLARYFIHDAMRGVDYLCTRPEVDPARIGVTGNSGGGTQTCMMMICDPRIAAAAPATFLMNRQTYMYSGSAQDAEQIWPGMTAIGFDHEDILMMMAPRPVIVLAAAYDFFPIEGTRMSVENTRRFWQMYGKGECIDLFEQESAHKYTRPMARKAAEFFSQHLLGGKVSPEDATIRPLQSSLLWCTVSGQVRGELEGARSVYDENLDRLAGIEKYRNQFPEDERKERAFTWLRDRVFTNRRPCDLNPRLIHTSQVNDLTVQHWIWWTQEGLFNGSFTFRDYRFEGQLLPVTAAVWDGGTNQLQSHMKWIRETCQAGRAVIVLDVSGVGAMMPVPSSWNTYPALDFYGIIFKLTHDLMWLNDSMAAMRTYDVIRALDMIELWPGLKKEDIQLYAHGRQGVYAQLAAYLDTRVKNIDVIEGMGSYSSWVSARHYDHYDIMSVNFPGMLNYLDLPDLVKKGR